MNDIKSYTLDDVSGFFKKYYSPSNATIVVAGNFEKGKIKDQISKYFEDIPASNGNTSKHWTIISRSQN